MQTERDGGDGRVARRAILTGGAGALAALAARALGSAGTAEAATGDPVLAGETTTANAPTIVSTTQKNGTALEGYATGNGGTGVYGVDSSPAGGAGLYGYSGSGNALYAENQSDARAAILGENFAAGAGISGASVGGYGVVGGTTSDSNAAVYGTNSGAAAGVLGQSATGYGVHGSATSDTHAGVMGDNTGMGAGVTGSGPNRGVHGLSSTGVGVLAEGATALQVNGPAVFQRSGLATVLAGSKSVQVTGVSLAAESLVLATVQGRGKTVVQQVVPDPAGSSFVIYVNKTTADTPVAWFVVN